MLEFKDAKISVGGRTLVENLSFTAGDGRLTCVVGAEGSGKTTFLRALMGFLPLDEGFVSVDGELLTIDSAHAFRSQMVYLPQEIQSLRHQLFAPEPRLVEADEYAVWNSLLPSVEPESVPAPLLPEEIYRLVELTLQHATDKQIVIADEPIAHLSVELAVNMLKLLRQQADLGKTVLVASRAILPVVKVDKVLNLSK